MRKLNHRVGSHLHKAIKLINGKAELQAQSDLPPKPTTFIPERPEGINREDLGSPSELKSAHRET